MHHCRPYTTCVAAGTSSFVFFQEEDGIRDSSVTGVQTCALPISEIVHRIESIALDTPGISHIAVFAGLSGATRTQASNSAALFPVFEEPEKRIKKGLTAAVVTADLRKRLSAIQGAFIIVIPPPPIPGIGTGGGFTMRIQDRQGRGGRRLPGPR